MMYQYPLQVRFKILAFAPQISVTDKTGKEILYIEQKLFALREAVRVYNNEKEKKQIYGIKTQQVIDFGAQYYFYQGTDETTPIGSIKEEGLKTLFKATYTLYDKRENATYTILEKNPWVNVADSLLNLIPYAGFLTGFFLHPAYQVLNVKSKKEVMILQKEASFFERQFRIEIVDRDISRNDEVMSLLGIIMLIQLQKERG